MTPQEEKTGEGWKSIETAPRNADLLLFSPDASNHGIMIGYWSDWENGGPEWSDCWTDDQIDVDPTHWQPLPEPPSQDTEMGK